MNLEELRKIVFEKQKVPYYIEQTGEVKTAYVFDKKGMNIYKIKKDEMTLKMLIPFAELTEEDLTLISEKLPKDQVRRLLQ